MNCKSNDGKCGCWAGREAYPEGVKSALHPYIFPYIRTIANDPLRSQAVGVKAGLIIRPDNENIICAGLIWSGDKSRRR